MSEPITREEMYFAALGGEAVTLPDPLTREELYLAYLNGMTDTYPDPITRTEQYLYTLCQNGMGSGGAVTIRNQNKTITENGTYRHDSGYTGLGPVTVNVPQDLPVVEPLEVTENGTYNPPEGVDGFAPVTVNVEASGGGGNALLHSILDRSITEFIDHEIVCIGSYAFYDCKSLKTVKCNNATFAYSRAFAFCTALETADLPNCAPGSATPAYLFQGCTALHTVNIPEFTRLGSRSFSDCKVLEKLDLPKVNTIDGLSFENCTLLSVMILRNNVVASLSNINAFNNTPFASGGTGGTVYCPASLITQYQQATNWSTLYAAGTCNFVAIEGSEYE